jgi:hypothetical protein
MLNKLKWRTYRSTVLAFSIAFAGSGIYMLWLEVRRSAAHESLNSFTVESWKAMANSPHRQATMWEMVMMFTVLILSMAVVVSPVLALWKFLILPESRESQIAQVECDDEDHHDQVRDDVIEETTIRINKNVPLRRSLVYSAKEKW